MGEDRDGARDDRDDRDETEEELPADVADEAQRLTRLARAAATDEEAAAARERRDDLLADNGYVARVREEDDTLVCHPASWLDEARTVDIDAVEDVDRGVERPLSGAGDPDDWGAVADHNDTIAASVRETHGEVHGDTAAAFAAFMSNHYARRVETAGRRELREFREGYFPRNTWPTDDQRDALEASLRLVFEAADRDPPAAIR